MAAAGWNTLVALISCFEKAAAVVVTVLVFDRFVQLCSRWPDCRAAVCARCGGPPKVPRRCSGSHTNQSVWQFVIPVLGSAAVCPYLGWRRQMCGAKRDNLSTGLQSISYQLHSIEYWAVSDAVGVTGRERTERGRQRRPTAA